MSNNLSFFDIKTQLTTVANEISILVTIKDKLLQTSKKVSLTVQIGKNKEDDIQTILFNDAKNKIIYIQNLLKNVRVDMGNCNCDKTRSEILANIYTNHTEKLTNITNEIYDIKTNERSIKQHQLKEHILMIDPDLTEQEITQIMLSDAHTKIFFDQKLFVDSYGQKTVGTITTAYNVATEKYNALLELESSMEELHELMVDFSNLVMLQGNLVEEIGKNIAKADADVAKGTEQLYLARKHQLATRKTMCCGCTIM